ncbi:MAG: cobalamin-binding protein [Gammaproteobacteria bacterium]
MKIVSLLPSATEIICALGLSDELVGVTHECDYPPSVTRLPKVTRTLIPHDATSSEIDALVRERLKTEKALYNLDMDVLRQLQPDLLITQALCDVCAVCGNEVLAAARHLPGEPQVINLVPMSLDDLFKTLLLVGEATNRKQTAEQLVSELRKREDRVIERTASMIKDEDRLRVVFLEWIDPPFNAGHWTPELVELAGGIDCIGNKHRPSETTPWQSIVDARPDVLVIACCGYSAIRTLSDMPILQKQPGWDNLPCVRQNRVYLIDGSTYFNRPGPRLVDSLEIIAHTLYPDVHPLPPGLPPAVTYRPN